MHEPLSEKLYQKRLLGDARQLADLRYSFNKREREASRLIELQGEIKVRTLKKPV